MGAIVAAFVVAHTPRIRDPEAAGEVFRPIVQGMRAAAAEVQRLKPDVILIASCHWVTTFHPYVNAASRHRGILTSQEVPDLIHGWAYDYPGDTPLARVLAETARQRGIPVVAFAEPTFVLEYGTVIPLRYLTPRADVPVVPLSICWVSDLAECVNWGEAIRDAVNRSDRRAIFIASGAFTHRLVRGPEAWPTPECQELDRRLIELLVKGQHAEALAFLPEYVKQADPETGGRHIAMLRGATGPGFRGRLLGYGPSSGSGNPVLVLLSGYNFRRN